MAPVPEEGLELCTGIEEVPDGCSFEGTVHCCQLGRACELQLFTQVWGTEIGSHVFTGFGSSGAEVERGGCLPVVAMGIYSSLK